MTKYSKDILDKAINHGKKILNITIFSFNISKK